MPLRSSLRLLLAAEQIKIRCDFQKSGRNRRAPLNRLNFTMECALGLDGGVTRVFVDRFWRRCDVRDTDWPVERLQLIIYTTKASLLIFQ